MNHIHCLVIKDNCSILHIIRIEISLLCYNIHNRSLNQTPTHHWDDNDLEWSMRGSRLLVIDVTMSFIFDNVTCKSSTIRKTHGVAYLSTLSAYDSYDVWDLRCVGSDKRDVCPQVLCTWVWCWKGTNKVTSSAMHDVDNATTCELMFSIHSIPLY
jgi:hypothetical protein